MKILMLSEDVAICIPGTNARKRMEAYAALFDELHVVVLAGPGYTYERAEKLFLYPAAARGGVMRRWRMYEAARIIIRRVRCDMVSVQGPNEVGLIAYAIARMARIPWQLQIHTDVLSPYYRRAGVKEFARWLMARFLIPRASCIRVVSERIKQSLIEFGVGNHESRITVLPIFTDTRAFLHAEKDAIIEGRLRRFDFKMLAVGRMVEREKNFLLLIEAMADFVKAHPSSMLMIVGEGPDRSMYEAAIRMRGLENNVMLESWRDDLPSLFQSFDVFFSSSRYEGWGRAVLEAMASSVPVIMTDTGVSGEIVRDRENGRVVAVEDREAFGAAMEEMHQDPDMRRRLALAGERTARALAPETQEEYLVLYKRSCSSCILSQE